MWGRGPNKQSLGSLARFGFLGLFIGNGWTFHIRHGAVSTSIGGVFVAISVPVSVSILSAVIALVPFPTRGRLSLGRTGAG